MVDLRGRDFLKLLDFTPEEITYLLDLAADLKDKKKKGIPVDHHRGKNVALTLRRPVPARAALSRWARMISVWGRRTSSP